MIRPHRLRHHGRTSRRATCEPPSVCASAWGSCDCHAGITTGEPSSVCASAWGSCDCHAGTTTGEQPSGCSRQTFPVLSRNKFDFMWRYIHLQDNTVPAPVGEKVWKLRWFLNHLTTRFQEVYTPYQNCTIDESMIKFKGRLSFRQYLPAKPIKWGDKGVGTVRI